MAYGRLFGTGFLPVSAADAAKSLYSMTTSGSFTSTQMKAGTTVPWDSKVFDTADAVSTTTYKFTCPSEGHYFIIAAMDINTASTLTIYKNTTAIAANDAAASYDNKVVTIVSAVAGDTFHIKASLASATAAGTYALASTKNYFAVFKMA